MGQGLPDVGPRQSGYGGLPDESRYLIRFAQRGRLACRL